MCAVNKYRKNKTFKINEITFFNTYWKKEKSNTRKLRKKFKATGEKRTHDTLSSSFGSSIELLEAIL